MKTFNIAFGTLALLSASVFSACTVINSESTPKKTVSLTVKGDYHEIRSASFADIEYIDGPDQITFTAPETLIDRLRLSVTDSILNVTMDTESLILTKTQAKLTISHPGVHAFTLQGSGDITTGNLTSDKPISILTSGSGDISTGILKAPVIALLTQGSGDVDVKSAEGDELSILTQGSGDVKVFKAPCRNVYITTQGSGDITVRDINATFVEMKSQGSGDISVFGKADKAKAATQGSGDINASLKCNDWATSAEGSGDIKR